MSLILDALNRSRQDVEPVPGLASQHYVEPAPPGWRQYLPWVALALAILLIAWLVLERRPGASQPEQNLSAPVADLSRDIESAATAMRFPPAGQARAGATAGGGSAPQPALSETPEPAAPAAAPVAPPAPAAPAATPVPPPAPEAPAGIPVAPPAPEAPAATPVAAPAPAAGAQEPPAAAPAADTEVAALYSRTEAPAVTSEPVTPARAGTRREEQPVDIEEMLLQAREEMQNTAMVEHPTPFLSSLSKQTRDAVPTILYQQHDYIEGGRSIVVLNGKKLRVGGSPVSGMKVDEILPGSVILNYKGTQFRLRALNSWVNL